MGKKKGPKNFQVFPAWVRAVRGPKSPGVWYWRAEVYRDGAGVKVWTGWGTKAEASEHVRAALARKADTLPARRTSDPTVEDALDFWMGEEVLTAGHPQSTVDTYRRRVTLHLVPRLGKVRAVALDTQDLKRYRGQRLEEGAAPRAIEAELAIVRMMSRWARKVGLLPDRHLEIPEVEIYDVRDRYTPTDDQVTRVVDAATGWVKVALHLYAVTGARRAEIGNLRWRDVFLDAAYLQVDGKTGPRKVNIDPWTVSFLRVLGGENPPLEETVTGVSPSTVGDLPARHIKRLCKDLRIHRFTLHGLRRAAVNRAARAGMDVAAAAAHFGHSVEVMWEFYREVSEEDLRRVGNALAIDRSSPPKLTEAEVMARLIAKFGSDAVQEALAEPAQVAAGLLFQGPWKR